MSPARKPPRSNSGGRGGGAGRGGAEGASLRPAGPTPQTSEGPARAPRRDSSGARTSLLSSAEGRCPEGRRCLGIEGDRAERLLGKAARAAPSAEGPPAQPPCAGHVTCTPCLPGRHRATSSHS